MRVLAVDYGDARTGVAFSDPTGTLTGDAFTITGHSMRALAGQLASLCAERGVGHIVLGYPKHMNGDVGERAKESERLAAELESRTGLPVTLWDERLTSVDANRIMSQNNRRGVKRKQKLDAVAASLILEAYLRRVQP